MYFIIFMVFRKLKRAPLYQRDKGIHLPLPQYTASKTIYFPLIQSHASILGNKLVDYLIKLTESFSRHCELKIPITDFLPIHRSTLNIAWSSSWSSLPLTSPIDRESFILPFPPPPVYRSWRGHQ